MRLNNGHPLRLSKKTRADCQQRLKLIRGHSSGVARACEEAFANHPRTMVARNDILNSAAIAVAMAVTRPSLCVITRAVPRDEANLLMNIFY